MNTQTPINLSNQLKQVESGAPKLVALDAVASASAPETSRIQAPALRKSTFEKKAALKVKSEDNGVVASNRVSPLEAEDVVSSGMVRGSTNLSNMDANFAASDDTRTLRMNNKNKMNQSEDKPKDREDKVCGVVLFIGSARARRV